MPTQKASTEGTPTPPLPEQDPLELARAGRPEGALRYLLQAPDPDPSAVALLERLTELRASLRAKAWDRAQNSAEGLFDNSTFGTPSPASTPSSSSGLGSDDLGSNGLGFSWAQLGAEVTQLKASGQLLERGEAQGALALLQEVSSPLLAAEAETQRGTAQVFLGEMEAAKDAFSRALELDPKHYRAQTNLGNVALEEGRIDDAIALYEGALKLNEAFPNAHHNLGVAYRRKGQVNRSVKSIRRAQRVSRQKDRDAARAEAQQFRKKTLTSAPGRTLRWLLYGAAALGIFVLLRSQGVI